MELEHFSSSDRPIDEHDIKALCEMHFHLYKRALFTVETHDSLTIGIIAQSMAKGKIY